MTIFDLPLLTEGDARSRVNATLSGFPYLAQIFDAQTVEEIIRRRLPDNYLLFLLAQPGDERARDILSTISRDLQDLAAENALEHFRDKLKSKRYEIFEGYRTEIELAARMKRKGFEITLDAPTRVKRNCDFSARTDPATLWEIKTVQDVDFIREDASVEHLVYQALRYIEEPYFLTFEASTVALKDAHKAIKSIKKQIALHHRENGIMPGVFSAFGLNIHASPTSKPYGYLGLTLSKPYGFTDEISRKIRGTIKSAAAQLPDAGGGIVVIDTTVSDWADREDVIAACFGSDVSLVHHNVFYNGFKASGALFRAGEQTRISAVVHYSRHPRDRDESPLFVIHNPFASKPLDDAVLASSDLEQSRWVLRSDLGLWNRVT